MHPEPLTGPDVSLSTYPARTTLEGCRLPPRPAGSSCCQLTLIDLHAGSLPPSLHESYPASPLLRSSPPLACASVLSASRFLPLVPFPLPPQARFSSSIRKPRLESRLLYTGHRLASKQVSARLFPELGGNSGFDVVHGVSMRHQRFTCARLSNPHMT